MKGLRGSEYSKKYNEVKSAWTAKFNALFFIIAYVLNCQKQNTMEDSIAKLGKLGT